MNHPHDHTVLRALFLAGLVATAPALHAQTAKEIVARSNDLMRGSSSYAEVTMTIVKPEWSRTVAMKIWSVEPDYAMVYVTAPARDKGSVTLKRKNEVWNWLPSVQRVIKLPPSMMLQSWMGSDFTNDDLVRQSSIIDDYTHTLLGEETIEGRTSWKVSLVPRADAGVVWGKVIMWISKVDYLQLRTDFYDEDGEQVRTFTGSMIRKFGDRTLPAHFEMVPVHEPGKKTVLHYNELRFDKGYEPSFFSEQNMKRVR
ncbi:MAG: outer membrane lipoprotein-sorting protein [Ignavibacteriae bacterium]|nr:outer membrane lipoprotein-sorting protein [Ignavibacteriota bacterium]